MLQSAFLLGHFVCQTPEAIDFCFKRPLQLLDRLMGIRSGVFRKVEQGAHALHRVDFLVGLQTLRCFEPGLEVGVVNEVLPFIVVLIHDRRPGCAGGRLSRTLQASHSFLERGESVAKLAHGLGVCLYLLNESVGIADDLIASFFNLLH